MLTGKSLGEAVDTAIRLKGVPKTAVAAHFGIKGPSIYDWIKHGRIGKQHLTELVSYFSDVVGPEHWGMPANGDPDQDWADVTGYSQAAGLGAGAEADEYAETHKLKFKATSLRRRGIYGRPLAVYYGKGDSMEPTISDGDAILFDTSDTRVADGGLYVIQVDGMARPEYFVKRAMVVDGMVLFQSDNPEGDHHWRRPKRMDSKREPITVIGRVHWIGGWAD